MTKGGLHEDFRRHAMAAASDRAFGLVFSGFLTIVALWPVLRGLPIRWPALLGGALFLGAALLIPGVLHPLNLAWTRLGLLLNLITTPLFMGLIYFLIFAPVGIVRRLAGADPLRLATTAEPSYWIKRDPPGPPPESATRQY